MADGAGGLGGLGGTLFENTKNAVGQQVKQTVQTAGQQITGKPVGQKPQGGTFNMPQGGGQKPQGLDDFGDFAKLFEKNAAPAQQPAPQAGSGQMSQQQLQQMQSEQDAKDAQKIAQLTQELHQMYAKKIMDSGENVVKQQQEYMENLRKEEEEKWAQEKEVQAQQAADMSAPGQMQPGQLTSSPVTSADRSGEAGKHTG